MSGSRGPRYIRVRYSRPTSFLMTGMGGVLMVVAALSLFMPFIPLLVPIGLAGLALLGGGLRSFFGQRYLYNPSTGGLTVFMAFGPGSRGLGAPKGERVFYDGRRIVRELPDGTRRRVSSTGTNRADLARLVEALPPEHGQALTER
ncbi:hypothetical protein [Glycomyces paridis]|uniref:Uncharacterized protein n=1 Tax=Glycomyces paridis TaxID=2126555 RepID=A0A4S8PIZ3_9ACTN|nr:hypothetical protein [Glycomyces paridis]THV28369.1 hypothetical protein E9998_12230 [Glycomyces paridis]